MKLRSDHLGKGIWVIFVICVIFALDMNTKGEHEGRQNEEREKIWENDLRKDKIVEPAIELLLQGCFPRESEEKEEYLFSRVGNLWFDGKNNIFISDEGAGCVLKMDIQGNIISTFGRKGQGPGEFSSPREIHGDHHGRVYIKDSGTGRIQVFSTQGEYLNSFKLFKPVSSFDVNEDGNIFCSPISLDLQAPLIEVLDDTGALVNTFGNREKFPNISPMHNEIKIALNHNNEIIAAWEYYNIIRKYDHSGQMIVEAKINDRRIEEADKVNRKIMRLENRQSRGYRAIRNIYLYGDRLFVFTDYPRLKIFEMDDRLNLIQTFWADRPYAYMATDFFMKNIDPKGGRKDIFFILRVVEENAIEIYAPKSIR